MKEVKGYPVFNEVKDTATRIRNCGVTMANIFEDRVTNARNKEARIRGAHTLISYFNALPDVDMLPSFQHMKKELSARGYEYKGTL